MRDGVCLSADVYRPDRPGRFGAILEHIPYRKDDLRAMQDRGQNLVLAEAGFACIRLDVRGTGSSEGVAVDEYTEAEQLDGVEVVDWISNQEWCNGNVGSWGKSYGGFSCIQLAARRPPALRAIAPVYATDDRYSDDMHYDGGAVAAFELTNYPVRMIGMNALPPGDGDGDSSTSAGGGASTTRRRGCCAGWPSSRTGRTGETAPCAPTTSGSSAPCSSSPAGTTATARRGCEWPGACEAPGSSWPDRGRTSRPIAACHGRCIPSCGS